MEKRDDFIIPEETAEWIGLKKSEYLSKLINSLSSDDFGFEEFHHFDSHIPNTLENPDRVFEETMDGQIVRTYLRTYVEKMRFHQIVFGVMLTDKERDATVFIPILTFVSKKDQVVKEFCVGEVMSKPTLN